MSGAIIPAPLAMPLMTTVADPSFAVAVATFGNVSVVMIALAASIQMSGRALCTRSPITLANLVAGKGSPMTPVEASRISLVLHSAASAASFAVNAVAARPLRPVKALALPELTTRARALPDLSFSRHQSTGADGHFDRVSTPAAVVPGASRASRTSVRFGYLIPAAPVASVTPAIGGNSGTWVGARGEIEPDMSGWSFAKPRWSEQPRQCDRSRPARRV